MGVSTDAQICFGVALEEGFEPPVQPSLPDEDEDGNYQDLSEWYDDFDGDPIELVLHCSYDYPMYIIAAKGSLSRASRGYPSDLSPEQLDQSVSPEAKQAVVDFCREELAFEEEPVLK